MPDEKRILRKTIKYNLLAQGFDETLTFSTTNQESLNRAKQGFLFGTQITNPLSQDQQMLRPSLLTSMLNVAAFNFNRGQKNLRIFEAGKIYIKEDEIETLGLIMAGERHGDWRQQRSENIDFYDLKGSVGEAACSIIGNERISFVPTTETIFEESSAAHIELGHQRIGSLGKIDEEILENFGIKDSIIWFAQMDLEALYAKKGPRPTYNPISPYPAVVRDISLTFDGTISYEKLLETIKSTGMKNVVAIDFKEDYTDIVREKIEPGHRGILISLTYQSHERTLEEDEVNADHQKILQALIDGPKAIIR